MNFIVNMRGQFSQANIESFLGHSLHILALIVLQFFLPALVKPQYVSKSLLVYSRPLSVIPG